MNANVSSSSKCLKRQAEEWASEMEVGPLSWNSVDDKAAIAWVDNNNHSKCRAFVVRSIILPLGEPPA